jgi:hypothetical protein
VNPGASEFARRRTELQLQCALQREQLAHSVTELQGGFQFADRVIGVLRGLRVVPMLLAAVSAAGVVSRASGVIRLIGRVWLVVNTLKRLRQSLR